MPRPSLKEQRTELILDACETCVARYGLDGVTLERVAEEADLARALIRHNVGNREDLLEKMTDRFFGNSVPGLEGMIAALPDEKPTETMIEWLFDPAYSNKKQILVASALVIGASSDPALAEKVRLWITSFIECVAQVLCRQYSDSKQETLYLVATGITNMYFNVSAMSTIGDVSLTSDLHFRELSKAGAQRLLDLFE